MSEMITAIASNTLELPPKPEEPLPGECCERGCVTCVWVYYERALERWRQTCDEIRMQCPAAKSGAVDIETPRASS